MDDNDGFWQFDSVLNGHYHYAMLMEEGHNLSGIESVSLGTFVIYCQCQFLENMNSRNMWGLDPYCTTIVSLYLDITFIESDN